VTILLSPNLIIVSLLFMSVMLTVLCGVVVIIKICNLKDATVEAEQYERTRLLERDKG
jgi:hypothetical protein